MLFSTITNRVLEQLDLSYILEIEDQYEELESFLQQIGALCTAENVGDATLVNFDVFLSALKVHGYQYGDQTIMESISIETVQQLGEQDKIVMVKLAQKVAIQRDNYLSKLDENKLETVRQKHIDLISVVLLAFFDDVIEHRLLDTANIPVMSNSNFIRKL